MTSTQMLTAPDRFDTSLLDPGGSEVKLATVMFVDIRGSMALSRAIQIETWGSLIGGLFELMSESVYQYGGWVANFTGDGVEGVFEASDDADDHAQSACEAALWLREAIRAPAAELCRDHALELSVRIGINSGDVLTGTIGSRYRRYYTANGYAVALAKRMEALALPDRIYLTEHTAALVAESLELCDLGAFEIKGADTPVGVFELLGSESQW
jgi:class 3 adenylate cyclase